VKLVIRREKQETGVQIQGVKARVAGSGAVTLGNLNMADG